MSMEMVGYIIIGVVLIFLIWGIILFIDSLRDLFDFMDPK